MNESILLQMYDAYNKENNIDFSYMETKYSKEYAELKEDIIKQIKPELIEFLEDLLTLAKQEEQAKFEEEKKHIIKIGMQIGMEFNTIPTNNHITQNNPFTIIFD